MDAVADMWEHAQTTRLIETDAFAIEFLSAIAERESWRKEVYRPIYHLHKWWANRLGSIFRAIILGSILPADADLESAFYSKDDHTGISVFDPFMGSGTTVGEAHKLGCIALGRDINPVACESVRVALGPLDRHKLENAFQHLSSSVGERIKQLYRTMDDQGRVCDVLYYFWVKVVPCVHCSSKVELFPTRVIARNAYPDRKPEVQVCCPRCGNVFGAHNSDERVRCSCGHDFSPHVGLVTGPNAVCPVCGQEFAIIDAVRRSGVPPEHKVYAKLLLTPEGSKRYASATQVDVEAYVACQKLLEAEVKAATIRLPTTTLSDGYNTRQAIGYNYRHWRDFFNARQLLALGWLQDAIAQLPDADIRDALLVLFSGLLEFNNLFTSYKGEGTGAVRHMFAHHILKPERTPIEANTWGTPKSSGSFSNLFKTRLGQALDYRSSPFEVQLGTAGKVHFTSAPFTGDVSTIWPPVEFSQRGIYLSCGSSEASGLPDACIDLVVTDPPFFDNVHYSELADFFYAWQHLYPRGFIDSRETTRDEREVQDTDAGNFATKLCAVLTECHRVLKDDGLLVFTYHHSRSEGWASLAQAVVGAGFSIIKAHPVKAEMSVAAPKAQAKEPIQLDIILVCKKVTRDQRRAQDPSDILAEVARRAKRKLERLAIAGLSLSRNDRRIVVVSEFLSLLGPLSGPAVVEALLDHRGRLERMADGLSNAVDTVQSESKIRAGASAVDDDDSTSLAGRQGRLPI